MLKAVLGVIAGYVVMSLLVFVMLTAAWFTLKEEGSFKPASWEVSTTWLIVSFVVGFVAAVVGGFVCALVASSQSKAWMALSGLVLILGLGMAVSAMNAEAPPEPRPAGISMVDAMTKASQPKIALLLTPLIGAAGVAGGACLRKKCPCHGSPSCCS